MTKENRSLIVASSPSYMESDRMKALAKCSEEWPYLSHFCVISRPIICDACAKTSKADAAIFCPHLLDNLPAWRTNERMRLLESLMSPEVFRREILGEAEETETPLFPTHIIRPLFFSNESYTLTLWPPKLLLDTLFFGIDPAGGESKSDYGITVLGYTHNADCVVS
jgi:hypothetical protein